MYDVKPGHYFLWLLIITVVHKVFHNNSSLVVAVLGEQFAVLFVCSVVCLAGRARGGGRKKVHVEKVKTLFPPPPQPCNGFSCQSRGLKELGCGEGWGISRRRSKLGLGPFCTGELCSEIYIAV